MLVVDNVCVVETEGGPRAKTQVASTPRLKRVKHIYGDDRKKRCDVHNFWRGKKASVCYASVVPPEELV